jgi:lipid-A-disaccharide synthase
MREAGARLVFDAGEIAVVGVWEVLARLPRILEARRRLRDGLRASPPDRAVLIDYPDFNLRFARDVKRVGIPLYYFVSPQVWAWRPGRITTIARLVDHMMVVFPFEEELYRRAGVPVTFVGHPLVDSEPPAIDRREARNPAGMPAGGAPAGPAARQPPKRGRAPSAGDDRGGGPAERNSAGPGGRRPGGLDRARAARALDPDRGGSGLGADGARSVPRVARRGRRRDRGLGNGDPPGGLPRHPMVVVYRIHPATAWLGRRLVRISNIALVNLVAGRTVVPELLQEQCTPERIAGAVAPLLDDPAAAARVRADLMEVRSRLGAPGAFERAARLVLGGP